MHVVRRLVRDVEECRADDDDDGGGGPSGAEVADVQFPYVVLDECGAMLEPDAVGALTHGARALLLVGDHHQLSPFTKWRNAQQRRYDVSLMERLATSLPASLAEPSMLRVQYRMHPAICGIVSRLFYRNALATAPELVARRRHPLPVCFVQVSGSEDRPAGRTSFMNEAEAQAVAELVAGSVGTRHALSSINVLSFYNEQRARIQRLLAARGAGDVDVVSVDSMQGREADVVILSCVRTSQPLGFLNNRRRINVALSRARETLILVGDAHTLTTGSREWRDVVGAMQRFDNVADFASQYKRLLPEWKPPASPPAAATCVDDLTLDALSFGKRDGGGGGGGGDDADDDAGWEADAPGTSHAGGGSGRVGGVSTASGQSHMKDGGEPVQLASCSGARSRADGVLGGDDAGSVVDDWEARDDLAPDDWEDAGGDGGGDDDAWDS